MRQSFFVCDFKTVVSGVEECEAKGYEFCDKENTKW